MNTLFGRKIVETSLDPVPPLMRGGPGMVVLNQREISACETVKEIATQLNVSDRAWFDEWLQKLGAPATERAQ